MSPLQEKLYWREWGAVHKADPSVDRHDLHIAALGEDKSHKLFTNEEFDKVLGQMRAISRPTDLDGQLRQLNQQKTRLIWKIEVYLANFLRLYRQDPAAYILSIALDKNRDLRPNKIVPVRKDPIANYQSPGLHEVLKDLDVPHLEHIRSTLTARLNHLRKTAGHTIHDMHILAGVQCDCAPCAKRRRLAASAAALPEPLPF